MSKNVCNESSVASRHVRPALRSSSRGLGDCRLVARPRCGDGEARPRRPCSDRPGERLRRLREAEWEPLLLHERPKLRDRVRAIPKQSRLARQRTEARLTLDRSLDSIWLHFVPKHEQNKTIQKPCWKLMLSGLLRLRPHSVPVQSAGTTYGSGRTQYQAPLRLRPQGSNGSGRTLKQIIVTQVINLLVL